MELISSLEVNRDEVSSHVVHGGYGHKTTNREKRQREEISVIH